MAKYLTIDIGNSSAKALVWIDGLAATPVMQGMLTPVDIEHLCAVAGGKFDCAAICSVTYDDNGLADAASRLSERLIDVSASTPSPIALTGYESPLTLGADRIAAMAGAAALMPGTDLLVVDCGTAVTYDRLSAQGVFMGGNIAPGIGMRLRALHAFTARLPEVPTDAPDSVWGATTSEAMRAGAFCGVAGEIEYYLRQCPRGTKVVLTGGRAADAAAFLTVKAALDPDLVLKGLKYIIEYNENQ